MFMGQQHLTVAYFGVRVIYVYYDINKSLVISSIKMLKQNRQLKTRQQQNKLNIADSVAACITELWYLSRGAGAALRLEMAITDVIVTTQTVCRQCLLPLGKSPR